MIKKYYPKIEYSVVLLALFAVILLAVPFSVGSSRQANFISKWNEKFNKVEYMFSVVNAHTTDDMLKSMKNAKDASEREKILLMIIKPYLRINTNKTPNRHYKPKYMNGAHVNKKDLYYFEEFYFSENKTIVGIKDINSTNENDPFFIMMFDMNGLLPPNRWGKDIFGVNIYDEGKIEPFGYSSSLEDLKKDCSKSGRGVGCSYYYKIGGGFDD